MVQLMINHLLKRSSECCWQLFQRMVTAIYTVLCCKSQGWFVSKSNIQSTQHCSQERVKRFQIVTSSIVQSLKTFKKSPEGSATDKMSKSKLVLSTGNEVCQQVSHTHISHQCESMKKRKPSLQRMIFALWILSSSGMMIAGVFYSLLWCLYYPYELSSVAQVDRYGSIMQPAPYRLWTTIGQEFLYATTLALQHHLQVYYSRHDMQLQLEDILKIVSLDENLSNGENNTLRYDNAWRNLWNLIDDIPIDKVTTPSIENKQPLVQIDDTDLSPKQLDFIGTISPPLLKYMVMEGEYIDRGMSTKSPIGSMPPIFIVGFPRSGLTLLQKLISLDPRSRTPRVWETLYDVGDSRSLTFEERHEAAKKVFLQEFEAVNAISSTSSHSDVLQHHASLVEFPFESELDPADDEYILGNALSCNIMAYEFQAGPAAIHWSRRLDVQIRQMQFHKRWVQLYHNLTLSLKTNEKEKTKKIVNDKGANSKTKSTKMKSKNNELQSSEFWIFRGSDHVERIESILSVYPDAKFIWAHHSIKMTIRKQLELAVKSMGSNTLFPTPHFIRMIGQSVGRSLNVLDNLFDKDQRVSHVQLNDLLSNPIATLETIYQQLGMGPMLPVHVQRIEKWINQHWRETKKTQVSWPRAWRLLGMHSELELFDIYKDYLDRFPNNL